MKKVLSHIFIDGVNGMALGFFATFALGTILQQLGIILTKDLGDILTTLGGIAVSLTGAGIAAGMATKFGATPAVALSAIISGMVGAYAEAIYESSIITKEGLVRLSGPGDPLGAFIAALIALEVGNLIAGKTEFDLMLTPLVSTGVGCASALLLAPVLDKIMSYLVQAMQWCTKQNTIVMGILIASMSCIMSLLPISLLTLIGLAKIHGIAAGAVTIGCCCSMIGFAVSSYRDNKLSGLFVLGVGTAKLQLANIFKKPYIILPPLVSSAILGGIASGVFKLTNTVKGASMGTTGLVGCLSAYGKMMNSMGSTEALILVSLLCFVLPGVISLGVAELMRKGGILKDGDAKISL